MLKPVQLRAGSISPNPRLDFRR